MYKVKLIIRFTKGVAFSVKREGRECNKKLQDERFFFMEK